MTQENWISRFLNSHNDSVIIGSLGNISEILEKLDNGKNKIITVKGAMGCVMGIGLGYALNTEKQVYVLIGDGAFLMKAGSLATIAKYNPGNLQVIILNNNKHESCGGQPTSYKFFKNGKIHFKWLRTENIT